MSAAASVGHPNTGLFSSEDKLRRIETMIAQEQYDLARGPVAILKGFVSLPEEEKQRIEAAEAILNKHKVESDQRKQKKFARTQRLLNNDPNSRVTELIELTQMRQVVRSGPDKLLRQMIQRLAKEDLANGAEDVIDIVANGWFKLKQNGKIIGLHRSLVDENSEKAKPLRSWLFRARVVQGDMDAAFQQFVNNPDIFVGAVDPYYIEAVLKYAISTDLEAADRVIRAISKTKLRERFSESVDVLSNEKTRDFIGACLDVSGRPRGSFGKIQNHNNAIRFNLGYNARFEDASQQLSDINEQELKILSFGCSSGEELSLLKKKFPNAKIYGCDIDIYSLSRAHHRLQGFGEHLPAVIKIFCCACFIEL